jgi:hypothetical protein
MGPMLSVVRLSAARTTLVRRNYLKGGHFPVRPQDDLV